MAVLFECRAWQRNDKAARESRSQCGLDGGADMGMRTQRDHPLFAGAGCGIEKEGEELL